MSSRTRVLYVGVTNDIERRVQQHQDGIRSAFTSRCRVKQLVYCEETSDVWAAPERKKQLKGWARAKKLTPIESVNPEWRDLSAEW